MKPGRAVRRGLWLLLAVYAVWLGWRGVTFRRWEGIATAAAAAQEAVPPPDIEVEGVYHLHSRMSDGRRTPDQIAALAAEQGLDFIVLTDHGAPNRGSLAAAGRRYGVLVLAGSEISTTRGHLVALGFDPPARDFDRSAEGAAAQTAAAGGFTVIAHPFAKNGWSGGAWAGYAPPAGPCGAPPSF